MVHNFKELVSYSKTLPKKRVAVIFPSNEETFLSVKQARDLGVAGFLLVGDERVIHDGLKKANADLTGIEIIQVNNAGEALLRSIRAAQDGHADILMKGSIDTSTMMKAVLSEEAGMRIGRILSDVFIFEFPQRSPNKFLMITDGGITLAPDLKIKVELIDNAVEVAHALGNPNPRVAVLSATEFVLPDLPSTLDAAVLSKMNERGQIRGCVVDGPLALDCAISPQAAEEKNLTSPVAGKAEILIAPNIESANSLAKSTTYFAGLPLAHVIVGGRVPVLIPSRADKADARLHSIALGVVMSEHQSQEDTAPEGR